MGAQFEELSEKLKEKLGIEYGIQIKNMKSGKLKNAGIPSDFIILKANNRIIRTEEDLNEVLENAMSASERDKVLFLTGCTPQGRVQYYAVNLAD